MKKIFAITAVVIVAAGATMATASARSYRHHHHHGWSFGFRGSNAELRGNYANSLGGRNSAANPRNAGSRP